MASYRNYSINLLYQTIHWFLYDVNIVLQNSKKQWTKMEIIHLVRNQSFPKTNIS